MTLFVHLFSTDANAVDHLINCDLYIRHVKQLRDGWLPGFNAMAYVYISDSIPMLAFKCLTDVHIVEQTNKAYIYIKKAKIGKGACLYLPDASSCFKN